MKPIHLARAALAALLLLPLWAGADPFAQSGAQMKTWLVTTLGPYAVIAVIGCGLAALAGMLRGATVVMIMLGIFLIFGADQIVALVRSWGGV